MHKQLQLWRFTRERTLSGQPVVLLYVLDSSGSSPGRQGFGMAVAGNGDMQGSIGGGMMEHKMVELARTLIASDNAAGVFRKQIHDREAARNRSGMICSGEQSVHLRLLRDSDALSIGELVASLEKGSNGTLEITPGDIRFHALPPEVDFEFRFHGEDDFTYREKTGYREHLYIVGGGHCALALSRLMCGLDFKIHLIEERPRLNTLLMNKDVDETFIVGDYSETGAHIPDGPSNFVVIMTFGYRTDLIAVRTLRHRRLAYLGVLGSRSKIENLFRETEEGDPLSDFETPVRAPIGIAIKSRTPEEIAVSIAAEIIQVKNRQLR